jgi:hypothetical protein
MRAVQKADECVLINCTICEEVIGYADTRLTNGEPLWSICEECQVLFDSR